MRGMYDKTYSTSTLLQLIHKGSERNIPRKSSLIMNDAVEAAPFDSCEWLSLSLPSTRSFLNLNFITSLISSSPLTRITGRGIRKRRPWRLPPSTALSFLFRYGHRCTLA
jgi:hypothetical protein